MKNIVSAVSVVFVLSGCAAANKPMPTGVVSSETTRQGQPAQVSESKSQDSATRLIQCRKELDALQSYNSDKYQSFKSEFERTAGHLKKYLEVKNGIGSDINDLAMPKYQFTIRDVCFRIKNDLATSIVKTI